MRISDWSSDVCSSDLAFAHLLKLALYDFQLLCRGVEGFGAGCTVGNEMALIFLRINQGLAGRDADHNGALWHVPGHNRISTHASTRTDDNGPQYLRSRTNDRAIANGGVPLARDSVRRVRSAQGHALINGDIVPDLRRFPYDGKAMINKKVSNDHRPRVHVTGSQKTGEIIDQEVQTTNERAEKHVNKAQHTKQ